MCYVISKRWLSVINTDMFSLLMIGDAILRLQITIAKYLMCFAVYLYDDLFLTWCMFKLINKYVPVFSAVFAIVLF